MLFPLSPHPSIYPYNLIDLHLPGSFRQVFNLPPSAQEASQIIASLYASPSPHSLRPSSPLSHLQHQHADPPPIPIRIWTLKEECHGGRKPGEEDSVWLVYQTHDEVSFASARYDIFVSLHFLSLLLLLCFRCISLCFLLVSPISVAPRPLGRCACSARQCLVCV